MKYITLIFNVHCVNKKKLFIRYEDMFTLLVILKLQWKEINKKN
jgi:hypothetical protein